MNIKKTTLLAVLSIGFVFTSCDRRAEHTEPADHTSQQILGGAEPEQFQGSTGLEDGNYDLESQSTMELRKFRFNGSFASQETQTYNFEVQNADTYNFRLESSNPDVTYIVSDAQGQQVVAETSSRGSAMLQPGKYVITANVKDGGSADSNTSFTIHVE
ncbi:MAG: hypothetical protein Q4F57_09700 [Weeksellaceae bacterium]|nr:hypothetical protein [Weeksellaceae bacterium]